MHDIKSLSLTLQYYNLVTLAHWTNPPVFAPPSSQREDQEPGEGGVFPSSHQVSPLQFEEGLVSLFHDHQAGVGGSFPGHILVTSKR